MTDAHTRFRIRLAAHLSEALPESDAAWMESHAAECPECTALLARVRAQLPTLESSGKHAPVSLLERWVREPGALTALERELLERHLGACDTCRADAAELARLLARTLPRARMPHHWRGPLGAGIAAAAVLAVVLVVRLRDQAPPPLSPRPQPVTPGDAAPAVPPVQVTIALLERSRSTVGEGEPAVSLPAPDAALRLILPPLFLEDSGEVLVSVERRDGTLVWSSRLAVRQLADTLAPVPAPGGWRTGRHRVRVVPDAGRDSAAAREFGFRLLPPQQR